jgi:pyruvate,orthophosphate dikinase
MPKVMKKAAARSKTGKKSVKKAVKRVYFFGNGKAEGGTHLKDLLGGKGANLADMTTVPLPVPPGFTITTETCGDYNDLGQKLPAGTMKEVREHLARV